VGTKYELNVIKVRDKEFLVTGGNGTAVHLTREARSAEVGRPPFHDWRLNPKRAEGRVLRERYALASLEGRPLGRDDSVRAKLDINEDGLGQ
jgi:hypothetical protein